MSEDFLTRWSRRKRDAVEIEQVKVPDVGAPGERDTIAEDAIAENATPVEPVEAIKPAAPPEPAFDLKSLPSIESITSATDIRPFLAPGVPVDIARAALRRAWSTDPRIRDFVGLADYDWDYHTPGSAAGFGPLEMTDELRRMVARIVGDSVEADTPEKVREPATGAECVEESPPLRAEAERLAAPGEGPQPVDLSPNRPGPAVNVEPTDAGYAALQHKTPQDQVPQSPQRRGHGSALPK
jgi:uncharacterized protein DUF3306